MWIVYPQIINTFHQITRATKAIKQSGGVYHKEMDLSTILFPPVCVGCGCLGVQICARCSQKVRTIEKDWCLFCGNTIPSPTSPCPHCAGKHETLPVLGFWYYESVVSRSIWSIKYKQNKRLIQDILLCLGPRSLAHMLSISEQHRDTILVPVPLHPNREKERGYNQSLYIAKLLGALTNIPVMQHAVERVRETLPQAHCTSKTERLRNIQGAFRVKEPLLLKEKTLVLVDDVVTTGSTVREISREINKHFPSRPIVVCLAREEHSEKYHGI